MAFIATRYGLLELAAVARLSQQGISPSQLRFEGPLNFVHPSAHELTATASENSASRSIAQRDCSAPQKLVQRDTLASRQSGSLTGGLHGTQTPFSRVHRGRPSPRGIGYPIAELARKAGVHENTVHLWKKKYGRLGTPENREMNELRDENTRLKRLVADLTMDKMMLQDVLSKNF